MSKRKTNANVSSSPLSRDERQQLQNLLVLPDDHASKSKARQHFGSLYARHDPAAAQRQGESGEPVMKQHPTLVDGKRLYCKYVI